MQTKECPTYEHTIHIAGFEHQVKEICSAYCTENATCVYVQSGSYLYNHGKEFGMSIKVINYPKRPRTAEEVETEAVSLATRILSETSQRTCSIIGPDKTILLSK